SVRGLLAEPEAFGLRSSEFFRASDFELRTSNSWFIRGCRWGGPGGNQLEQPDSGHAPMPAHRWLADSERVGDLLMLESDEIAQLHHFRFDGVFPGQGIEGFMHQQKLVVPIR